MRHRPVRFIGAALLCAVVTTTGCGTRMDRADIALAERGGLQLTPGTDAIGAPSQGAGATDAAVGGPTASPGRDSTAMGDEPTGVATQPATRAGSSAAASAPSGSSDSRTAAGGSRTASASSEPVSKGASSAGTGPAAPGTTPAPGQGTAPGATAGKRPVAIGTVTTLSGPIGGFVKDWIFPISVWTKWINGRNGVNGHPVRHIVVDDGGDPARYNAAVRQLVEEQGVIAFLFNGIGYAGGDLSYLNEKRVPVIGHDGGTEFVYNSPMVFTPFPSGVIYAYTMMAGIAQVVVPQGRTKLGTVTCTDIKLCDMFDKEWNGPMAKELGFDRVYRGHSSITQPDFTAECLAARQAGAEVIIGALDQNSYLRLARSCTRQNYKPILGIGEQLAQPSVAADPVMEGSVVSTKLAPWADMSIPGVAELHRVFAEIAPGVAVHGGHSAGWVAAKTFELAARNLPDNPTAADVLNGLWSINGDTIGGFTYPLHFPKDQPSPRKTCWGSAVIQGGKYVASPNSFKCK